MKMKPYLLKKVEWRLAMKILIGENIKQLRKANSITQEQLAEALNITCAAVSKWERGVSQS